MKGSDCPSRARRGSVGNGGGQSSARTSKLAIVSVLGLLTIATAIGNATPAAASSGIRIYVGYADSLRANAVSFPTPWVGSPRTVFEGCNPAASCVYDAGAVQVYNGSSSTIHVDAVAVARDTCVYSGWPSVNLPSRDSFIVTQPQSGAVSGCLKYSTPKPMDNPHVGANNSNHH